MTRKLIAAGAVALALWGATATSSFAWDNPPPKHPGMHCAKWGHPFIGREGKLVFWCKTWAPGKPTHPKGTRRHCLHYTHVPRGQHRHCVEWS